MLSAFDFMQSRRVSCWADRDGLALVLEPVARGRHVHGQMLPCPLSKEVLASTRRAATRRAGGYRLDEVVLGVVGYMTEVVGNWTREAGMQL